MKFNVRASEADKLSNAANTATYTADEFMNKIDPAGNSSAGTLTIQNALPLILGPSQNFEISANTAARCRLSFSVFAASVSKSAAC